jgi:hypothetical protein
MRLYYKQQSVYVVYFESHSKHIDTLSEQDAEL